VENTSKDQQNTPEETEKVALTRSDLISFAMDVGFSIALPLAGFAYVGILIDKNYGSSPIFLIIGLILSLFTTTIILMKKVRKYLK
jgi:F0F1-type ATP synthase assembly protein I